MKAYNRKDARMLATPHATTAASPSTHLPPPDPRYSDPSWRSRHWDSLTVRPSVEAPNSVSITATHCVIGGAVTAAWGPVTLEGVRVMGGMDVPRRVVVRSRGGDVRLNQSEVLGSIDAGLGGLSLRESVVTGDVVCTQQPELDRCVILGALKVPTSSLRVPADCDIDHVEMLSPGAQHVGVAQRLVVAADANVRSVRFHSPAFLVECENGQPFTGVVTAPDAPAARPQPAAYSLPPEEDVSDAAWKVRGRIMRQCLIAPLIPGLERSDLSERRSRFSELGDQMLTALAGPASELQLGRLLALDQEHLARAAAALLYGSLLRPEMDETDLVDTPLGEVLTACRPLASRVRAHLMWMDGASGLPANTSLELNTGVLHKRAAVMPKGCDLMLAHLGITVAAPPPVRPGAQVIWAFGSRPSNSGSGSGSDDGVGGPESPGAQASGTGARNADRAAVPVPRGTAPPPRPYTPERPPRAPLPLRAVRYLSRSADFLHMLTAPQGIGHSANTTAEPDERPPAPPRRPGAPPPLARAPRRHPLQRLINRLRPTPSETTRTQDARSSST